MILFALGVILFLTGIVLRPADPDIRSRWAGVQAIGLFCIGVSLLWLIVSWLTYAARRITGAPPPRFTTILFDLDGTLTDPQEGITNCIRHAIEALGYQAPPPEDLRWCIGPPLRENLKKLLRTEDPALLDKGVALYRERFGEKGMYENALFPDTREALSAIRDMGFKMYIASSKPLVYVRQIVAHFGIDQYFDGIHGSELNGDRVHKEDLIRHILQAESLDPATTLMVGDRELDILGARACGCPSAAVSHGYGTPEELASARPDFLFNSLTELAAFLALTRNAKT